MNTHNDSNAQNAQAQEQKKEKTICLVQITRMGDVIQTLHAARELKKSHPDIRLLLIARTQYAKPLDFILSETFDKCIYFNLPSILETKGQDSLDGARHGLSDLLSRINEHSIDVTINLSYSKSSSYLCSLIKSTFKLGPFYSSHAKLIINDKWSQYLYSNVLGGNLSVFSLIDIFKKILGANFSNGPFLKSPDRTKVKKSKIVIHPFASNTKKSWRSNKWCEVVYKLLKDNPQLQISLVGSKKDIDNGNEITSNPLILPYSDRIKNYVGQTSIKELFLIVKNSSLLIGHDSLGGNIAALYGVQALTISLGCVRPIETTPYGEYNYNLAPKTKCFPCFPGDKCDLFQCHSDIPYQVVTSCAQQLINEGRITKKYLDGNNSCFHLNSVYCYKSYFSNLKLQSLSDILEQELNTNDAFRLFYRIVWPYLLEESEEKSDIPFLSKRTKHNLLTYVNGLEYLYELSEFGKQYSKLIIEEVASKTPDLSLIKQHSAKIDEIDQIKATVKKTYPKLAPLIDYFSLSLANLKGKNIVELSESSFLAYHTFGIILNVVYELIEKTIGKDIIENNKKNKEQTQQLQNNDN